MKPLLTHDWIEKIGGSETVLKQFQTIFPNSNIFTLWNNTNEFQNVNESFLRFWPFKKRKLLSILPSFFIWNNIKYNNIKDNNIRDDDIDFILASSHSFAHHSRIHSKKYSEFNKILTNETSKINLTSNIDKGGKDGKSGKDGKDNRDDKSNEYTKIKNDGRIKKLVYCHTPARWLWNPELDKRGASIIKKFLGMPLKIYDYRKAQEIHAIAANSNFIKNRIKKAWGLNATVIYPPVDVKNIINGGIWKNKLSTRELNTFNNIPKNYLLGASRLINYKRLDIVIKVAGKKRMPVVIAGNGPMKKKLQKLANKLNVDCCFINDPSKNFLYTLYQEAFCYIFPAIEDFGIMPVECMATGTPVITAHKGGAIESVENDISGFNTPDNNIDSYTKLIDRIPDLNRGEIISKALNFSKEKFNANIKKWIKNSLE